MQKLLLLSILIATVTLPVLAAKDRSAKRGVKKTLFWVIGFNVLYLVGLKYLYFRL